MVGDNGVTQAGVSLSVSTEPERFWPTATGTLTNASMTADKATRSTGELAAYADKLLIVKGINLPYSSNGCSHSAADAQILTSANITPGSTNCKAMGISVDTADRRGQESGRARPAGDARRDVLPRRDRLRHPRLRLRMSTPQQPRVYIDSPYKAYPAIIGAVGNGTTATSAQALALMQRAGRSKSINDILRPQIQALLNGRTSAPVIATGSIST